MTGHKDGFQVQRLEVVNTGRRRRWSEDEKVRIVEESFQDHRQVSATARRHDISPSLLFSWRKAFGEDCRRADEVFRFAPAMIVPEEEVSPGWGVLRLGQILAAANTIVWNPCDDLGENGAKTNAGSFSSNQARLDRRHSGPDEQLPSKSISRVGTAFARALDGQSHFSGGLLENRKFIPR